MRPIDADRFECVVLRGCSDEFAKGAQYILEMIDDSPTLDMYKLGHDEGYLEGLLANDFNKVAGWGKIFETGEYFCTNCRQKVEFPMRQGRPVLYPSCPYCNAKTGRVTELIRDGKTATMFIGSDVQDG